MGGAEDDVVHQSGARQARMSMSVGAVSVLEQPAAACENLDRLVEEVQRSCAHPVSMLQVAALLESAGVTDGVARSRYQEPDVFALAQAVTRSYPRASLDTSAASAVHLPEERLSDTLADYSRGLLAIVPILLLTLTIMVYQGFARWRTGQVVALSVAMIGSLLVTGGFVQALSRKGSSYLSQGYIRAAQRVVALILGVAVLAMLAVGALCVAALRLSGWLAPEDIGLMAVAYIALSLLWLAAGLLHLLKEAPWFGVALGICLGLSNLCLRELKWTNLPDGAIMLLAAAAGLAGALAVTLLVARAALSREAAASPVGDHHVVLAPSAQLIVGLAPYFVYGLLSVVFVLSGHLGGWAGALRTEAAPLQGVATIEIGLTVALISYMLAGGVAENTMRRFWRRIKVYQSGTSQAGPDAFNRALWDFFVGEQARYLIALSLCSYLVASSVLAMVQFSAGPGVAVLPWSAETTAVFLIGQAGYFLMGIGVFSCMFMITLSQPGRALGALARGTAATAAVGLAIALVLPYQYTVFSVVAGGLVFAISARVTLRAMLADADHAYYASF